MEVHHPPHPTHKKLNIYIPTHTYNFKICDSKNVLLAE